MSKRQKVWQFFRQHRIVSIIAGHVIVMTVLATVWLAGSFGPNLLGAFAQAPCGNNDKTYVVVGGDTLGAIAFRHNTTWQKLSDYNKLSNPNLIYISQHICIPGQNSSTDVQTNPVSSTTAAFGTGNYFPYGQCTWWGNQRYWEIHGVYVPWTINSNAWQWNDRAREFGWKISETPKVGSIMVLQPWIQGTWGLGHVAIVEEIYADGSFLTSNMNWGAQYTGEVTYVKFWPGAGVTFLSH